MHKGDQCCIQKRKLIDVLPYTSYYLYTNVFWNRCRVDNTRYDLFCSFKVRAWLWRWFRERRRFKASFPSSRRRNGARSKRQRPLAAATGTAAARRSVDCTVTAWRKPRLTDIPKLWEAHNRHMYSMNSLYICMYMYDLIIICRTVCILKTLGASFCKSKKKKAKKLYHNLYFPCVV